jgi:hypothetical protein
LPTTADIVCYHKLYFKRNKTYKGKKKEEQLAGLGWSCAACLRIGRKLIHTAAAFEGVVWSKEKGRLRLRL